MQEDSTASGKPTTGHLLVQPTVYRWQPSLECVERVYQLQRGGDDTWIVRSHTLHAMAPVKYQVTQTGLPNTANIHPSSPTRHTLSTTRASGSTVCMIMDLCHIRSLPLRPRSARIRPDQVHIEIDSLRSHSESLYNEKTPAK